MSKRKKETKKEGRKRPFTNIWDINFGIERADENSGYQLKINLHEDTLV